jgi:Flp pilus assembly pilin Flp
VCVVKNVVVGGSSTCHHFFLLKKYAIGGAHSGAPGAIRGACLCTGRNIVFRVQNWLNRFLEDESAQGITEYGAILAFVAILVALTFGMTTGTLMPALSAAFSAVASQLDAMAATASSASGS